VLADTLPAAVHDMGEIGEEARPFWIIGLGNLGGPGGGGERGEAAVAEADAGAGHGGDVTGAGQVPPWRDSSRRRAWSAVIA
jgi:hypothetical protein